MTSPKRRSVKKFAPSVTKGIEEHGKTKMGQVH